MNRRQGISELTLGVDGGATKTHAVITDAHLGVVGEGFSGPSNPLRVGIGNAAAAIREAVDKACAAAGVERAEITAAQIGLAGVRRKDMRARMRETLMGLGIVPLEVVTDADIALFGATNGEAGVVVIAGTGSICCGVNKSGRHVCAGGWGPVAGDEGSGLWLARSALQRVAQAADGRGTATSLSEAACNYFDVPVLDELSTAIYAPNMTNDRLAGFGRRVIEAAQTGDAIANELLAQAGRELGAAVVAVIRRLHMERERFRVAYVGGVFTASELVLASLREEVALVAPLAFLAPPLIAPAVAAAHMAQAHLHELALIG